MRNTCCWLTALPVLAVRAGPIPNPPFLHGHNYYGPQGPAHRANNPCRDKHKHKSSGKNHNRVLRKQPRGSPAIDDGPPPPPAYDDLPVAAVMSPIADGSKGPAIHNVQPAYPVPRPYVATAQAGYGSPQPAYVAPQPAYVAPQPAYVAPLPSYAHVPQQGYGGGQQSGYGGNKAPVVVTVSPPAYVGPPGGAAPGYGNKLGVTASLGQIAGGVKDVLGGVVSLPTGLVGDAVGGILGHKGYWRTVEREGHQGVQREREEGSTQGKIGRERLVEVNKDAMPPVTLVQADQSDRDGLIEHV